MHFKAIRVPRIKIIILRTYELRIKMKTLRTYMILILIPRYKFLTVLPTDRVRAIIPY